MPSRRPVPPSSPSAPPTPPAPLLRVAGLHAYRGDTVILSDLDWTVERGQHWVVLGANGSGKTTLLAALTGYFTPSGGSIELLGQRFGASDWQSLRRRVGLVSSALRQLFHEDEPAVEIVVGGRYGTIDVRDSPRPVDVRSARQFLRRVDALPLADRPWAVLSQGERQRVLIARALMARPEILILDEPCAGLDPVARERFLDFLQQLGQRSGPALILVTHHVEEIVPVFDHALILRSGRNVAAGPTARVLNSAILSAAFDASVRLGRRNGRFSLAIAPVGPGRNQAWHGFPTHSRKAR